MILTIVGWYSQQLGSSSRCSFFFFLILIILRSQCQWPGMQKNSFWSISTMSDSEALSEDSSRGPDGRAARESHMAMFQPVRFLQPQDECPESEKPVAIKFIKTPVSWWIKLIRVVSRVIFSGPVINLNHNLYCKVTSKCNRI